MSFDWNSFLEVAERLTSDTASEAELRTAISRAYYAAYHSATAFIYSGNETLPSRDQHTACWKWYKNHENDTLKQVGHVGQSLKRLRIEADYFPNLQNSITPYESNTAFTTSKKAIMNGRFILEKLNTD